MITLKRLALILAVVLVAAVLFSACASSAPPRPSPAASSQAAVPAPAGRGSTGAGGSYSSDSSATSSSAPERMIIRNGNIFLVVNDVTKAREDITALAAGSQGYVVNSSFSGSAQNTRGTISIRVPDSQFDQVMADLRKLAVRVTQENTSSQDVTEDYIDLQARLKTAQATEAQYLELMKKATQVDDIIKIQSQLTQVQQNIEQIKGKVQYLERQVAMSLITINLSSETSSAPLVEQGWNFGEILKSAAHGFVVFLQVLATVLIWVVIFIPLWGGVLGFLYWRRRRKKQGAVKIP